jgi:NADPH:quinone reductase-like Zn-dependent oxidoreductase
MRAFTSRGPADPHQVRDVPRAHLERAEDVLVEVRAVAINPVDMKAVKSVSRQSRRNW